MSGSAANRFIYGNTILEKVSLMEADDRPIRHSSAEEGATAPLKAWLRKLNTSARTTLAQLGLTQDKAYGPNRRPIIAYAAIGVLVTAALFYMAGSSITGNVVMQKVDECQAKITERDQTISKTAEDLKACESKATDLRAQLDSANSQISDLKTQLAGAQQQVSMCSSNVDMLKSNVSAMQSYNAIMQGKLSTCQSGLDSANATVRNSVAAVCCSYADMQVGLVKNWQVVSDKIVCGGGSATVNCQTGALG
jgi:septal ring factor EnvC (AmiA/AmiB activator)